MDWNSANQIRNYIFLTETFETEPTSEIVPETISEAETKQVDDRMVGDLRDLVERFRSLMETSGGDYALGYETGMQKAAEMLENLINRHEDKRGPEIL
jgi:hypothetical protein